MFLSQVQSAQSATTLAHAAKLDSMNKLGEAELEKLKKKTELESLHAQRTKDAVKHAADAAALQSELERAKG
eukprot:COSAG05_NODE_504_length_9208_cov_22.420024_15_plen_71_part_01